MDKIDIYSNMIKSQKYLADKVILKDDFHKEIELVCGVDVSYRREIAHCCATVIKKNTFEVVEIVKTQNKIKYPYIPGLFVLRELGPILHTLRLLKNNYDLLLIDGNGLLHPRKCGLACYVGIKTNKPAIGVAKSLLCGNLGSDGFIKYKEDILGYAIKNDKNPKKRIYISIGNRTSLHTAVILVESLTKKDKLIPEPLIIADRESKN